MTAGTKPPWQQGTARAAAHHTVDLFSRQAQVRRLAASRGKMLQQPLVVDSRVEVVTLNWDRPSWHGLAFDLKNRRGGQAWNAELICLRHIERGHDPSPTKW